MDRERNDYDGACHCGTVRFRATLADGLKKPRRCDCSYCRMRGAVVVSARSDALEIVSGEEALTRYTFGSHVAQHWFCSRCGIYTHHIRRSDPTQFGVNVACLEGVSPFDFEEVLVNDGVNHPSDGPGSKGVAGVLRYERTKG